MAKDSVTDLTCCQHPLCRRATPLECNLSCSEKSLGFLAAFRLERFLPRYSHAFVVVPYIQNAFITKQLARGLRKIRKHTACIANRCSPTGGSKPDAREPNIHRKLVAE